MTQLSPATLRIRAGADTLVIGHRAAFGHGNSATELDSDEDVRRRLIQAMTDRPSLDSLRRFWARLQFDTQQITHMSDRALIDRVVAMTRHGPLAAYLVPDASVKHVLGAAVAEVNPRGPRRQAAPSVIRGIPASGSAATIAAPAPGVDAPFATGDSPTAPRVGRGDVATSGPLQVALLTIEERVIEVLRRAPRRMPAVLQEQSTKLFVEATHGTIVEVMTVWARMPVIGPGFVAEALLLADGLAPSRTAAMEAAAKFEQAFDRIRTARDERQFDEAAVFVAEAVAQIGIPAFLAAIWRGANRFTSQNKRQVGS
jgi:hypothetical protein